MGFFSKLKNNFSHGGVKVKVDAPMSVSFNDPYISVKVNITTEQQQTINAIYLRLDEEEVTQDPNGSPNPINERAKFELTEPFVLQAGESKTIDLNMPLNFSGPASEDPNTNPNMQKMAGLMDKVGTAISTVNALSGKRYEYYVNAVADVEGISFDPSDRIDIKLLQPGEMSLGGFRQRF